MAESVPVSPAAQAVGGGPPDLWWSPARGDVIARDRGGPDDAQVFGWRRDHGTLLREVPDDAVRLVPAPGPDTEAGARPRMRLLPVKASCGRGHHQGCAAVGVVARCGCPCHPRAHREIAAGVRTDGETPQ